MSYLSFLLRKRICRDLRAFLDNKCPLFTCLGGGGGRRKGPMPPFFPFFLYQGFPNAYCCDYVMVRVVFHSCNASSYVLLPIYLQECKEIKTYIESKSQHLKGWLGAVCPCVYMYHFLFFILQLLSLDTGFLWASF